MSDGRKRLSGYQYKKIADEKKNKQNDVVQKTKKLDFYFKQNVEKNENTLDNSVIESSAVDSNSDSNTCSNISTNTVQEIEFLENRASEHNGNIVDTVSDDPAEWVITDSLINRLLLKEIKQNMNYDVLSTKIKFGNKTRYLKKNVFYRKLLNGEQQIRKYIIYSPIKNALFCIPCRLFGGSTKLATEGLMDWRNINKVLKKHEVSIEHTNCQISFLSRSNNIGRIDSDLCAQINKEIDYWRNVLKRVIAVIKKLGSRGLPFRGSVEQFGNQNNGNFMMCLELISEFDPFLSNHIVKNGNPGSGNTSYLSSTICDELIKLISTKVTTVIVKEIKSAKYFSIVIDSTPDISHMDQLSFIIRYVKNDGSPVERFICFLPNVGHKAEDLEMAVMSVLTMNNIDINNCRGQSYDNAANMSGIYSGLQARLIKISPFASYIPCAAHSLNLVGICVAECVKEGALFFNTIQHLYSFFAVSTRRWNVLKSNLVLCKKVLKRVDGTRWSARHEACDSLYKNWDGVMRSLKILEEDNSEKTTVRCEASGLRRQLDRFETIFMTIFWNSILERFNNTSKELQKVNIDLGKVVELYQSLIHFITSIRNDEFFTGNVNLAKNIKSEEYELDRVRIKKRKLQADEERENEVHMSGRDKFKVETYFAILDRIESEMKKRCTAYINIYEKYNFLFNLNQLSLEEIVQKANKLQAFYNDDLEESFSNECLHFRSYLQSIMENNENNLGVIESSLLLRSKNLQTVFPNIDIAIRMLLCMAISNCSAERSFSTLKRIKNYLRSSLVEDKLNSLSLLAIESELLNSIDFEDTINEFANQKSRRRPMCI